MEIKFPRARADGEDDVIHRADAIGERADLVVARDVAGGICLACRRSTGCAIKSVNTATLSEKTFRDGAADSVRRAEHGDALIFEI